MMEIRTINNLMPPFSNYYKYKLKSIEARKFSTAKSRIETENPTAGFLGFENTYEIYVLDVRSMGFFYPSQISTSVLEVVNGPGFAHYYAPQLMFGSRCYASARVYHRDDLRRAEQMILEMIKSEDKTPA